MSLGVPINSTLKLDLERVYVYSSTYSNIYIIIFSRFFSLVLIKFMIIIPDEALIKGAK